MRAIVLLLVAAMCFGCSSDVRLNGGDEVTLKASMQAMLKTVPEDQHRELESDLMIVGLVGDSNTPPSLAEMAQLSHEPGGGFDRRMCENLHGKSLHEVRERARAIRQALANPTP